MTRNLVRLLLVVFALLSVSGMTLATDLPLSESTVTDQTTSTTDSTALSTNNTTETEETVTNTTTNATDTANESASQSLTIPTSMPADPIGSTFECYQPSLPSISLMTGGSIPFEVCVGTDYNGCDVMIKAMYYVCAGGVYPL